MAGPLTLHRASVADAAEIAAIYTPYVLTTDITFETEPPSATEMADRIAGKLAHDMPWIVALDETGRITGYAYAGPFHARAAYRFTVEPTVYVARGQHGRGIGKALYTALLHILTELGYRQAVALISLPNEASTALHHHFGFRVSGTHEKVGYKFDKWIDVGLFQRTLGEGDAPGEPVEPLPLEGSATWPSLGG